jgi:acrylyl-CoA reductase (NADPH)
LQASGVTPESGDVLVTGASGGVGSIAIMLLNAIGYRVVASTGKLHEAPHLTSLGASEVVDRALFASPGKPLQKERWAGVIDSVGSHTLANACAGACYGSTVVACGLAQGMDFSATVAPFILRSVKLLGIDSVMAPRTARDAAWARLDTMVDRSLLLSNTREIGLRSAIDAADDIMSGAVRGRVIVDVNH